MPVIDPYGLFHGQRLAACSDVAQLYWPRLFCAANTFARLELHLPSIINQCFSTFQQPPSEAAVWSVFQEYSTHYLALAYRVNGRVWVQFMTEEKYLKKHKLQDDKRTPAPSDRDLNEYKSRYREWKKRQAENEMPKSLSNLSEVFQTSFGSFETENGQGDGVGIGDRFGDDDDIRARTRGKESSSSSSCSSFSLTCAQEFWNSNRGSMRESKSLTPNHQRIFAARVKDGLTQELLQRAALQMAATPHFCGETTGYLGDFAWLLDANKKTGTPNFQNVLNGDYEPRKKRVKIAKGAPSYKDLAHHG